MQPIIKVENLSKQYRLGEIGTGTLSQDFKRWMYRMRGKEDPFLKIGESNDRTTKGESEYVWALKDINFEVMPGEVVGIIGKNGAGKSTLLKILSKVTGPTKGRIDYNGRIGSLLEVGTGFHPELTGRENIFLNGAILGMTKVEIRSKLDEIIYFSGCERYIDTPVKRYSSGMMVRLGFAVAAHLEPEILIVDEVLAVGDAEFQKKAIGKMQDVSKNQGRTVLFVSHNMTAVKNLCDTGIILKNGGVRLIGSAVDSVNEYISNNHENLISQIWKKENAPQKNGIKLLSAKLNTEKKQLFSGDGFEFEFIFENLNTFEAQFDVTFHLMDEMDNIVFEGSTYFYSTRKKSTSGIYNLKCTIPPYLINEGTYKISRIFFVKDGVSILFFMDNVIFFNVARPITNDGFGYHGDKMGIVKPNLNWEYYINGDKII